jgi:hypothetical protein
LIAVARYLADHLPTERAVLQTADDVRNGFDALLAQAQECRRAATIEQRLLSAAKSWVERLPPDAELVAAPVELDGYDLGSVQRELATKRERLKLLRSLPVPARDLAQQVTSYVANLRRLGAPDIRGLDSKLSIMWPLSEVANRRNLSDFIADTGNPLLMLAWAFPDVLSDRLVEMIEAEVNRVCPPAQRQAEISKIGGRGRSVVAHRRGVGRSNGRRRGP